MTSEERAAFSAKGLAGVKEGTAIALEEHDRMGRSIVVWRDGKVVHLQPEEYKNSIGSVLYPQGLPR